MRGELCVKELEVFGTLRYYFMYYKRCSCFKVSSQLLRRTWISAPARYPVDGGCTVRSLWAMAANPVNPAAQESFLFVAENERVGGRVCRRGRGAC